MVEARERFLAAGHYAPIVAALIAAAGTPETIVAVGAGTGYYLAALLDALPRARGLALDSSRPALRRAARAHERMTAAACDIWRALPVLDGAADAVVNVFAPRNPAEMRRILAPGGALIVVSPTGRHLRELALLGIQRAKQERLHATLAPLQAVDSRPVEFELSLEPGDVEALIAMGPSAHHGLGRRSPGRAT